MSKKTLMAALVAIAAAAESAQAAPIPSEVLGVETRTLQVKYQNGATEKYVVKYTGNISGDRTQDGHPAIPLEGKLIDTRRCRWSINANVVRQVFLANQNGELYEKKDLATPLSVKTENEGSSFLLIGLRPENCNDARARFESDVNNARIHVRQNMPAVVAKDLPAVFAILKTSPNVKVVLGK